MKNNQKGFGAVEGLLILVIVGLIGFIGWYVWHTKSQTDKSLNTAASTSAASSASKKTTATNTTPQTQYLKITELGIELPKTSEISDLTYTPGPTPPDGSATTVVYLQSGSKLGDLYHQIDSACDTAGQKLYLGGKILATIPPGENQQSSLTATANVKGKAYYFYAKGGAASCDPNGDLNPTAAQQAQINAYFSAVDTAVTNAKAL